MNLKINICFLTYNRLGIVARCFQSIAYTLNDPNVSWLILDNASTDGLQNWLMKFSKKHDNVHLFLSAKNKGVAGGRRFLFDKCDGEIIVSLDSDVVFQNQDVIKKLIKPLEKEDIGIVGVAPHNLNEEFQPIALSKNYIGECDVLSGYCQCFKRNNLKIVSLDENYNFGGREDDDFCFQFKKMGKKVYSVGDIGIHHVFSQTWLFDTEKWYESTRLLKEKWNDFLLHS